MTVGSRIVGRSHSRVPGDRQAEEAAAAILDRPWRVRECGSEGVEGAIRGRLWRALACKTAPAAGRTSPAGNILGCVSCFSISA